MTTRVARWWVAWALAAAVALGGHVAGAETGEVSGGGDEPGAPPTARPRWLLELEAGPVWQSRNDVQIPNDATGTRFALDDLAGSGPWGAGRVYLTRALGERHAVRLLVAPFSLTETGVPAGDIDFAGAAYAAGVPTEATYKFNSYRVGWSYEAHRGRAFTWRIGATAKIRDAKIELRQGAVTSRKTDVGFVPLLHLAGEWRFAPRWRAELDVDALAGGPGRAEDAALRLAYDVDRRWTLSGGYRLVEGGADVDEVYAFAWLHTLFLGTRVRF